MSLFSFPPLLGSVAFSALAFFLLKNKPRTKTKILFALLCLETFNWQLIWFLSFFFEEPSQIAFLARFAYLTIAYIPVTFYHFIAEFIQERKESSNIKILYVIATVLVISVFTSDLFVAGYRSFDWGNFARPGRFYPAYILLAIISMVRGVYILIRAKRNSAQYAVLPQQIHYLLMGLAAYFFCVLDFFQVYGFPIYPAGSLFFLISFVIIAYAITRHQLLDIAVIIKKTLVFAGLLTFVFAVFSIATFILRDLLTIRFGLSSNWVNAVSIFLIVLGYDPIRKYLLDITDRYLFQKKYDYQKLLKDASRGISKIENLRHLFSLVVHFITLRMRVKNASILSREKNQGEFRLSYARGHSKELIQYVINEDAELIRYLKKEKEAIEIEHVKEYIESGNKKRVKGEAPHEYDFVAIQTTMRELDASCCVPSFLGPELRNILVLGEKKSGDFYSEEDLNVLFTLAQESAIAIENARLYDEAINKTRELEEINSQLEYAKNLLMKALKETEVANKQLQDTQAQLIHEQKMATLGRLAASVGHEVNNPLTILSMNVSRVLLKLRKNPDLKVNEIMDTFEKMEQNIGRIKAVVNTLTGLLKKSEKGKFEPLSLKLILEETLPLVQFQTYLDNLTGTEVEFDVPSNLPLVRGDLERLQEVFLNLFINAYHAMEGRQHRRIRVYAQADPADDQMVQVFFKDNGKGMTDEIRKKIFNYGFTTKAPGKGSGLGLYMCKYIIELHGGDISVESKVGEGTTFIIRLSAASSSDVMHGSSDRRASAG